MTATSPLYLQTTCWVSQTPAPVHAVRVRFQIRTPLFTLLLPNSPYLELCTKNFVIDKSKNPRLKPLQHTCTPTAGTRPAYHLQLDAIHAHPWKIRTARTRSKSFML